MNPLTFTIALVLNDEVVLPSDWKSQNSRAPSYTFLNAVVNSNVPSGSGTFW